MRNIFSGIAVLLSVVIVSLSAFAASDTAQNTALWNLPSFVELSISNASFDFGLLEAGVDEVVKSSAVSLTVKSNTHWSLSAEVTGEGWEHLQVAFAQGSGYRNQTVPVTYTLVNLQQLDPGDYAVTVVFTVTTQ